MFIDRMVHIGALWYENWYAYVEQGDTRDSVIQALSESLPIYVLSDVTAVLDATIADSIMVGYSGYNLTITIDAFAG